MIAKEINGTSKYLGASGKSSSFYETRIINVDHNQFWIQKEMTTFSTPLHLRSISKGFKLKPFKLNDFMVFTIFIECLTKNYS